MNPINFNFHILIIEDNEGIRNLARKNLTREGYSVEAVGMGTEALEIIENNPPDLILLDQSLPDISGKEIILKLKERGLNIPFIVMTGQGSEEFAVEMMKLGARDYITKDFRFMENLLEVIRKTVSLLEMEEKLKRVEEKLSANEKQLRILAENTRDIIMLHAPDWTYLYLTPSVKAIMGYDMEELIGKDPSLVIHPEDFPGVMREAGETVLKGKKSGRLLYRVKKKSGQYIWLETYAQPLKNEKGEVFQIVTSSRDVSERIAMEDQLRRREEIFRNIVEHGSDIILILDNEGTVIYASPSVEKVMEYDTLNLLGEKIKSFIHQEDIRKFLNTLKRIEIYEQQEENVEFRMKHKNGSWRILEGTGINLRRTLGEAFQDSIILNIRDVTARKVAEEHLKHSEKFYRTMVEDQTEMICLFGPKGKLVFANEAFARYFNVSEKSILRQSFSNFFSESDGEEIEEKLKEITPGNPVIAYETHFHDEGKVKWQSWTSRGIFDEDDEILEIQAVGRDITDRKETQKELNQSRTRLELINTILGGINKGMAVNDIIHHTLTQVFFYFPAYRVVYAEIGQNGIMQAIDSHQPEFMPDITGLTVDLTKNCAYYKALTGGEMIIVSDVREDPLFKNLTEKMESNHVRAALDIPLHVSNGLTGLICLDSSEPRQWSDFEIETLKEVARYLTVAIQEARSMEEREKAEKKYRAVFNSNIVGIGISEKKSGKILDINETGARIFESTPEDLIGKKKSDYFLEPSVREELLAQIDLYAKVQDFQLQIKTEKNKFRWISLNSMLVQLDHQDYIVFLLTDITQKKLIQEELENHRKNLESLVKERTQTLEATLKREKGLSEELKKFLEKEQKLRLEMERTMEKERELMELKSRFISMASHEFRTPLTTILSASDILKRYGEKMTSEEKQVRIRKIQDQVGHMTDMLEDVLLIGQIESGKYNFHPQRADLKILVKQLTEDFKLTTGENHDIHTHFPEKEMPACVDKRLLQNIVTNLLTNAVKYSEPGSRIDVNLFEEDGEIRFQVQDRGIGISEEARQKLFDPFFRAENVGNISGTGLGLSILKNAVDMHRGSIHVDSKPGQGAAFTVSFKKDGGKHE